MQTQHSADGQKQDGMTGRVVLITGASSGIGLVTARELLRKGAHVVLVCRDGSRGQAALEQVKRATGKDTAELLLMDLSSQESIRAGADKFKGAHPKLHVLVNNAGVLLRRRHESRDGIEMTWAVNVLGPFLLTNLLLDRLRAGAPESSRVVNVSSSLHKMGRMHWDDVEFKQHYHQRKAYNQSKLALILWTRELARRVSGQGITVNSVHPGVVATALDRESPWIMRKLTGVFFSSPEEGAEPPIYLASSADVAEVTGKYFDRKKEGPTSPAANKDEDQGRLWRKCEEMTSLHEATVTLFGDPGSIRR